MSNKNTLFSYFKKVDKKPASDDPPVKPTEKSSEEDKNDENLSPKEPLKSQNKRSPKQGPSPESGKKKRKVEKPPKAEKPRETGKKFKRIVTNDSSDEEEAGNKKPKLSSGDKDWKPESTSEPEEELEESDESFSGSESEHLSESEEEEKPKKKQKSAGGSKKPAAKKTSISAKPEMSKDTAKAPAEEKVWAHMKFEFLKPEKIRDANKRRPDDPEYNTHTLFVPEDFRKTLTPAMRQWWEIKSKHFDCVIFIKLGKFYELYHMDATIGVNELNLIYMNHPEVAHAGFPEAAFGRYSSALVERNYKVARVEQTETPDMMTERCKTIRNPTKFDKVVRREVCQVTTKGTRLYLAIEGDMAHEDSSYLMAITEKPNDSGCIYGVCFVDTSIGHFHVGQFEDDRHKSQLRMLIAQYPPSQVLLDKGRVSDETRHLFETVAGTAIIESLAHESEFLSPIACLTKLHENKYFQCDDEGKSEWPPGLSGLTSFGDLRTPEPDKELALSALGGCLWYLMDCKIDLQLVCLRQFSQYEPLLTDAPVKAEATSGKKLTGTMILDATTLQNLDVVENSETGEKEGSLLAKLDNCSTPFGKRLLRQWLCSPLCSIDAIKRRQTAISTLMRLPDECDKLRKTLKELPDLERLFMKISVYGNSMTAKNHPESRAIFYQDFSKTKIASFLSLLKGFEKALEVPDAFDDSGIEASDLLRRLTRTENHDTAGKFPDFRSTLEYFNKAFDPEDALKTGKITPRRGVDQEFEACSQRLKEVEDELKDHLREVKSKLRCEVKYVGTDRKRFQIEIPEKVSAPSSYELSGSRKGFKRYYTKEAKVLLAKMQEAENAKKEHLLDINRRIFAKFAESANLWRAAIECLAILDILVSFAQYGAKEDTCMPVLMEPASDKSPFVVIKEGRLPTTNLTDFIPNDTVAGVDDKRLLLLTGPNMGGKSTLMRQFGLIVIMAQVGCPVPAESCELTPVDRIFTRIGAQDHILAGESTFFVEMSETSSILKHATERSIVLVDELGRGTTTFDGAAIASAVLESLVANHSLTIFSTHYHFLVDKYSENNNVNVAHMACMQEEEDDDEKEANIEKVTLLYKLTPGACPSSYGFNAARLAGLPDALVIKAKQQAEKLQNHPKKVRLFAQLMGLKLTDDNKQLGDLVTCLRKQLRVV